MIVTFLLVLAAIVWSSAIVARVVKRLCDRKIIPAIVARIDSESVRWLRKNQVFCESASSATDDPVCNDIDIDSQMHIDRDHGSATHLSHIGRIGALIAMYMVVCNMLIHWGSLAELIIGSIVGTAVAATQGRVTGRSFLQKFAVLAAIPASSLIIIRNYIDAFRIGLWVFNLSSLQLYLSQWLGVLMFHLIQRSLEHHKNPKNIAILWLMIIIIIMIL
jgi:hypothetical protein